MAAGPIDDVDRGVLGPARGCRGRRRGGQAAVGDAVRAGRARARRPRMPHRRRSTALLERYRTARYSHHRLDEADRVVALRAPAGDPRRDRREHRRDRPPRDRHRCRSPPSPRPSARCSSSSPSGWSPDVGYLLALAAIGARRRARRAARPRSGSRPRCGPARRCRRRRSRGSDPRVAVVELTLRRGTEDAGHLPSTRAADAVRPRHPPPAPPPRRRADRRSRPGPATCSARSRSSS